MRRLKNNIEAMHVYAHTLRVRPTRKNPPERGESTNLYFKPAFKTKAFAFMDEQGYNSLSELVVELVEREISRLRQIKDGAAAVVAPAAESPPTRPKKGKSTPS